MFAGISILYECVRTIMSIDKQSSNTDAFQQHRNTIRRCALDLINSAPIRQITAWLIGEYGDKLLSQAECGEANECLTSGESEAKHMNSDDEGEEESSTIEKMTKDMCLLGVKTADEVVAMLKLVVKLHKYQAAGVDRDDKINGILGLVKSDKQIEVQQRAIAHFNLANLLRKDLKGYKGGCDAVRDDCVMCLVILNLNHIRLLALLAEIQFQRDRPRFLHSLGQIEPRYLQFQSVVSRCNQLLGGPDLMLRYCIRSRVLLRILARTGHEFARESR